MLKPHLFSSLSNREISGAPSAQGPSKAHPAWGKHPAWWLSGHLLEAEVSFHFEMSLQVPRKEKNSCCCHHQLFPQIVQPLQLPLCTLLMKAGSWGPTWRQAGEVKEKVSHSLLGWGCGHFLSSLLPSLWGLSQHRYELALSPSLCVYTIHHACMRTHRRMA